MQNCEFVTFISAIACAIAKGKSENELNILSAVFSQLGDTLATISVLDASDSNADNNCWRYEKVWSKNKI